MEAGVLHFFMSYARGDDDAFVQQFFTDLSDEVRGRAGVDRKQPVGFLDTASIPLGARWSTELTNALSTSQCFLALTSPNYFLSTFCGKEFRAFSTRLDEYERRHRVRPPALLTIQWFPTRNAPTAANLIQRRTADLGQDYRQHGLRPLLKLSNLRDAYQHCVFTLADHIVHTAEIHRIPELPTQVTVDALPSAFHPDRTRPHIQPAVTDNDDHWSGSPRFVYFVIAACNRDEAGTTTRRHMDFYGSNFADWAPYRPERPEPIGQHATDIAADRHLASEIRDLDDLDALIDYATAHNQIVILLVDAWSTLLPRYRTTLDAYDRRNEPTTAVLVPCNAADKETMSNHMILSTALAQTFPRNMIRNDKEMFRINISTAEDFRRELAGVLAVAENRLYKYGIVYRTPPEPGRTRPTLQGP
jgi:FxsC-like protein